MGSISAAVGSVRRVAIIGAGPAGLACAKYLLAENHFDQIDLYEQRDNVRGAWDYASPSKQLLEFGPPITVPQTTPFWPVETQWPCRGDNGDQLYKFLTPMYDHLETNIPKTLMQFSDKPFPSDAQLYPTRQTVCRYLEEYAEDVRHLIKFNTKVIDICLDFAITSDCDKWIIEYQNVGESLARPEDPVIGTTNSATYDAIAICSGHYNVPFIPPIAGIQRWNERHHGRINHSKLYRSPEHYRDKKVIVVGNSASGSDIASQIKSVSQLPIIISQRSASMFAVDGDKPADLSQVIMPEISEFLDPIDGRRSVRFSDGSIVDDIDAILFCTGYLYSYPFLSSLHSQLLSDGFRVQQTYKHMFYIKHPSLAFLTLPMKILPFPLAEAQSAVLARVWSGRLQLPPEKEMEEWERSRIADRGSKKRFHSMDCLQEDLDHHNMLEGWASEADSIMGKMPHRWTEREYWLRARFANIKRAFVEKGDAREKIKTVEELGF